MRWLKSEKKSLNCRFGRVYDIFTNLKMPNLFSQASLVSALPSYFPVLV